MPTTSPRSSLVALAGRTLGAIPPTALVLLGIVSLQVGSALAKHWWLRPSAWPTAEGR